MKSHQSILARVATITGLVIGGFALSVLATGTWTAPGTGQPVGTNCTPPNCNADAPINVGTTSQNKIGGISLSTLLATGGIQIGSKIGSVTTPGTFRFIDGHQAPGYVLTTVDYDGNVMWQATSSLGIVPDSPSSDVSNYYQQGMWCGNGTAEDGGSGGTKNIPSGPWIPCGTVNPASSCPAHFTRVEFAWDTRPEQVNHGYFTCIKDNTPIINGCMVKYAKNYDLNATVSDNSCTFNPIFNPIVAGDQSIDCSISPTATSNGNIYSLSGVPGGGDGNYIIKFSLTGTKSGVTTTYSAGKSLPSIFTILNTAYSNQDNQKLTISSPRGDALVVPLVVQCN